MIAAIKKFFDDNIYAPVIDGSARDDTHALHLATAALMIEMSRADFHVDEAELAEISAVLGKQFGLAEKEVQELVRLAGLEVKTTASLYQFTSLIDKSFLPEQKQQVIEMLWRVAFADGHKDKYEEYLVRKVADLLHVSHQDFIRARIRVEERP